MLPSLLSVWLLFTGCVPSAPEGWAAGECTDGADNDLDGYFDCNDLDCFDDCGTIGQGGSNNGSGSAGTGNSNVSADAIAGHLTGFEVSYSMFLDFSGLGDALCESDGICDCTNSYVGTGNQIEAESTRVTFQGQWLLQDTDCTPESDLQNVIWYPATGDAYHTVQFAADLSTLKEWVVHGNALDTSPLESPSQNQQFWITAMNAPYNDVLRSLDYHEHEATSIEGLIPLDIDHNLTFTFE